MAPRKKPTDPEAKTPAPKKEPAPKKPRKKAEPAAEGETPTKAIAKKAPARKPAAKKTEAAAPERPKRPKYDGPRSGVLIIVGSPAKSKTLEKYLGPGYRVRASYGHVRDLPISGKVKGEEVVGISIQNGWKMRYEIIDRSAKGPTRGRRSTDDIIEELAKECDRAEKIYLATDPDREGESIAWHLEQELQLEPERTQRITFNEITKKAVQDALKHARDIDMNLVQAQEARRALDRLVGYPLSNLLGKKVSRGLSAGRVQSVAVRLVVERELEIEAFRTEEFWRISALLGRAGEVKLGDYLYPDKVLHKKKGAPKRAEVPTQDDPEGADTSDEGDDEPTTQEPAAKQVPPAGSFEAELATWAGKEFRPNTEADTDVVYAILKKAAYKVTKVEQKDRNDYAPPPFTTSSLQQQANIRLRMGAQRTMQTAQRLYEGVQLGPNGLVALITYMRTDSTRVSDDALKMVRDHIQNNIGPNYLPPKPNFFKSGKSAQEAHEAVRPTDLTFTPQMIQPFVEHDQFKLYELIYNRFVASQMSPALVAVTNVEIAADQGIFKAKGQIEKFDGYRRVWPVGKQEDVMLPNLSDGTALDALGLSATQHFTQPPPRYNEASLVKMLEKEGIGRPSTYATIISTITKKGYVDLDQRRFKATELGKTVTKFLLQGFPTVMDVKFTSHFEEELDDISNGKMKLDDVLTEFWGPFQNSLKEADANMPSAKGRETGEMCPKCGRPLIEMFSAKTKGSFISCSGWKDKETPCAYIKPQEGAPEVPEITAPCPTCGGTLTARSSRFGIFMSCSNYKKDGTGCNTIANLGPNNEVIITSKPSEFPCPKCQKMLLWRTGSKGPYFSCPDKECKTIVEADKTGEKPAPPIETGVNCEKCQSPMVVKKSWRGPFLSCSGYPKCRNAKPLNAELKEKLKDVLPPPPPKKEMPEVDIKELCPECGSALKLCSARGRYFLGCSAWAKTKCKGTAKISDELMAQIQAATKDTVGT